MEDHNSTDSAAAMLNTAAHPDDNNNNSNTNDKDLQNWEAYSSSSSSSSSSSCHDEDRDEANSAAEEQQLQADDDELDAAGTLIQLVAPHKMSIGQPTAAAKSAAAAPATVSLTGMAFNPPTQTLVLTTKTVIGGSVTYAVSQLRPSGSVTAPSLTAVRTRRYRPALEHHGDLRIASCGGDAPGELVCCGSDRTGSRHGVFRLQTLSATSQPVLAQCCGPTGDRLGQFNRPAGCAVDAGCVYVADRLNHRVQRLALPTLAPLAALRHPRLLRPSHLAVFSDRHYGRRLLLVAHERGVVGFDLQKVPAEADAGEAPLPPEAVLEFEQATAGRRARRWGGLCVHWGAVLLADQDDNCIRVYSYRPELQGGAGGFGLAQRLQLAPLGLCLPREVATHRWLDLLFVAAHDASGSGEVCVLTARMTRAADEES